MINDDQQGGEVKGIHDMSNNCLLASNVAGVFDVNQNCCEKMSEKSRTVLEKQLRT